jgi:hypothetical protein
LLLYYKKIICTAFFIAPPDSTGFLRRKIDEMELLAAQKGILPEKVSYENIPVALY